jgi:hypothetical protein
VTLQPERQVRRLLESGNMSQATATTPTLRSAIAASPIGRRELLLWVVICLLANQSLLLLDVGSSFDAFAASLMTQNDIYWLACAVALYRLYLSDPTVRASRLDCVLAFALGVLILSTSLLPYRFGIGLLATLVALYLLLDHGDRNLKAAGGVLLALSMQLVWGPIFFQLFTPELLKGDAALVGTVLMVLRPDIVWASTSFFAPDGHVVSLIAACSSFNNVSSALLACAAIAMLRRTDWVRTDIATILISGAAMILFNAARLCLFAWNDDYRLFWHDGGGATILAVAETFIVLAIAWWGAGPSRRVP